MSINEKIKEHNLWQLDMKVGKESVHQQAKFVGDELRGVLLKEENLRDAVFEDIDFSHATLVRCDFSNSVFIGANFSKAHIRGSVFDGANLNGANFTDSKVINNRFTGARLVGSGFLRTDLEFSSFNNAILSGAVFERVDATDVNFNNSLCNNTVWRNVILYRSNFYDAMFSPDVDFSTSKLKGVIGDGRVIFSANWFVPFHVVWTRNTLVIACKQKSIEEWKAMKLKDVEEYGDNAVRFFNVYRDILVALIDSTVKA